MPVPSAITDLSQTPGLNSPAGSEAPSLLDNYDRAHAAFIATLRDGMGFSAPVDLASAATTDIGGQASPFVRITGTTTITSFGTNYNGPRFLVFGGTLTLTHNATSLILPGGSNITTTAGDGAIVIPNAASPNGWRVLAFQSSGGLLPPGAVQAFALSSAPSGWLKANGSAVSRATYSGLFSAIGTTFGSGDGSTTFNLPDLRAEFIRGLDDGRGVDTARALGSSQGQQTQAAYGRFNSGTSVTANQLSAISRVSPAHASTDDIGNLSGNGFGGETRPRNVALLYCIKY